MARNSTAIHPPLLESINETFISCIHNGWITQHMKTNSIVTSLVVLFFAIQTLVHQVVELFLILVSGQTSVKKKLINLFTSLHLNRIHEPSIEIISRHCEQVQKGSEAATAAA